MQECEASEVDISSYITLSFFVATTGAEAEAAFSCLGAEAGDGEAALWNFLAPVEVALHLDEEDGEAALWAFLAVEAALLYLGTGDREAALQDFLIAEVALDLDAEDRDFALVFWVDEATLLFLGTETEAGHGEATLVCLGLTFGEQIDLTMAESVQESLVLDKS